MTTPRRVRVLLVGAAGRMGKTIVDLASNDPNIDIVAKYDLGDPIEPAMKNCDVVIDFSQADATNEICRTALHHRKSLVIGTTGHSQEQRLMIENTAQSLPIVFASNFSVGVNVLFWLTRKAAELLGSDFNPEIIETHHKMKKDAPSGTAKTLAEIVKHVRNSDSQIPIQSIREREVVGITPPVLFSAIYETDPVDCEPGAHKFLNAIVEFDYEGDPLSLRKQLAAIEIALGRPPDHRRYVSRKIDIDLLYCGDIKIDA